MADQEKKKKDRLKKAALLATVGTLAALGAGAYFGSKIKPGEYKPPLPPRKIRKTKEEKRASGKQYYKENILKGGQPEALAKELARKSANLKRKQELSKTKQKHYTSRAGILVPKLPTPIVSHMPVDKPYESKLYEGTTFINYPGMNSIYS